MNASVGRPLRLLLSCLLAVALALLVVGATQGRSLAKAADTVVGPGESIQKAIYAARPGDTIVVKGVHKEDVVIRKDGIKLLGQDAVIEAPPKAKADSPCSKAFGPEGICVAGDVDLDTFTVKERVNDVSVSGFTFRGFTDKESGLFGIDVPGARNATITGNRFVGNVAGGIIVGVSSIDTTVAKNHVIGNPKTNTDGITVADGSRNTKILNNEVRNIRNHNTSAIAAVANSVDTTIAGNDLENDWVGTFVGDAPGTKIVSNDITDSLDATIVLDSTGTKIISNDIKRSDDTGIVFFGPKGANNDARVVGNHISDGGWGIYVGDVTRGGSFTGNTIRNNCAGMFFEADQPDEHVGGFEVRANTVEDNTRSCRAAKFDRNVSGIGIALLGAASGMDVTGNHLSGNVPSGPTLISGGVIVSKDPYSSESPKPTNNTVTANHFGRNKPDIFWDKSGTGNSFVANLCNTSVPGGLCK